jgi:hypothetical protein
MTGKRFARSRASVVGELAISSCIPKKSAFAGVLVFGTDVSRRCSPLNGFMYKQTADGPSPFYWSFIEVCSYQHVTASQSLKNSIIHGEGAFLNRAHIIHSQLTGFRLPACIAQKTLHGANLRAF